MHVGCHIHFQKLFLQAIKIFKLKFQILGYRRAAYLKRQVRTYTKEIQSEKLRFCTKKIFFQSLTLKFLKSLKLKLSSHLGLLNEGHIFYVSWILQELQLISYLFYVCKSLYTADGKFWHPCLCTK